MSDYRRWFVPGGMVFLTVVTASRRPILTTEEGRSMLHDAIEKVRQRHPFGRFATVLLPDHWHLVMSLPAGEDGYSIRMRRIKDEFTSQWIAAGLPEAPRSEARKQKGERGIWQPRFFEHTIRDEDDLERCVDYIHWNPRKHGLVSRVQDWPWSSFHRFVRQGQYAIDWGGTEPDFGKQNHEWGE